MPGTLERKARNVPPRFVDVEIRDLTGQQTVRLKGLRPETPIADIMGLSKAGMTLPPSTEWNLRDERSSRLLRQEQTIGEVAGRQNMAELRIQPEARLG